MEISGRLWLLAYTLDEQKVRRFFTSLRGARSAERNLVTECKIEGVYPSLHSVNISDHAVDG